MKLLFLISLFLATNSCSIDKKLSKSDLEYYHSRAVANANLGKYKQAIKDFDKVIVLDSNHITSYYNRGLAYSSLHKYQKALIDFNKVIKLNTNSSDAYRSRGNVYYHLKQYSMVFLKKNLLYQMLKTVEPKLH